jgi:hypothetical protein
MSCEACKEKKTQVEPVPYIVHEAQMARMERVNKRWFWAWLITFTLLVGGIIFFFWRESQFEVIEKTVTQDIDSGDGALVLTGIGDLYYGASEADNQDKNPDA